MDGDVKVDSRMLQRRSLLVLGIAALSVLLVLASWPGQVNQPLRCRVIEIGYEDHDWRIDKEVSIFDDSKYVLRLFSADAPYLERRLYRGRLPPALRSRLLASIDTDAFWKKRDGVPTYRYTAMQPCPEIILEVRRMLRSRHISPDGWFQRFVRWGEGVFGFPVN
jgi:hypothetical protein